MSQEPPSLLAQVISLDPYEFTMEKKKKKEKEKRKKKIRRPCNLHEYIYLKEIVKNIFDFTVK